MAAIPPSLLIVNESTERVTSFDNSKNIVLSNPLTTGSQYVVAAAFDGATGNGIVITNQFGTGRIHRTTDGGATWTQINPPTLATNVNTFIYNMTGNVAFGNNQFMILCGSLSPSALQCWTSSTGAENNWTLRSTVFSTAGTLAFDQCHLRFTPRSHWYMTDSLDNNYVGNRAVVSWVSTNNGVSWSALTSDVDFSGQGASANIACSNNTGTTLFANDWGIIWKYTTGSLVRLIPDFYATYPVETGTAVELLWNQTGWYLLFDSGRIWKSTDDGTTWIEHRSPGFVSPTFLNTFTRGLVIGYLSPTTNRMTVLHDDISSTKIATSPDAGLTWYTINELGSSFEASYHLWVHSEFQYNPAITHFYDTDGVDCGLKFVDKDYMISVYPNLIPERKRAGMWAWGDNYAGKLGTNDTSNRSSPTQIGSLPNWKQIECSGAHTAAIKTDGTLWTCGYNVQGQLGDGTTANKSSPIQIGALTDWKQITTGEAPSTAATKMDGTLWTWGWNNQGQLGQGTTANQSSPTQVGSSTDWAQVTLGYRELFAIKTNGTLWSCGYNSRGQLGLGDTVSRSTLTQIGTQTNWKQVACGGRHTAMIKQDGTLWTCGYNFNGQLGLGDTISRSSPVQVGMLNNWKQVSCGYQSYMAAVKTDGTLWTWGYNNKGQLGDSSQIDKSSPIQIGTLTNWKQVDCGRQFMTAIKTDGTLWAWGDNVTGQLGNGTTVDRSSPIQIGALNTWKQVSSGYRHSAAIKEGEDF